MARRIICIFAASLLMLVNVLAAYARPVRHVERAAAEEPEGFFTQNPTSAPTNTPDPTPTPKPTNTPKPSDQPDPSESAEPTESSEPTDRPTDDPDPSEDPSPTPAGPTARPTIAPIGPPETPDPTESDEPTPKPTHRPHNTNKPDPTEEPTPTPAVPSIFWAGAESSVITVLAGSEVELTMVDGLADGVEFTGLVGELPAGLTLANDTSARSVRVNGVIMNAGETEFALGFNAGGMSFELHFRMVAKEGGSHADGFPEARYMVPFGGDKAALLPSQPRRREEDAV